MKQINKMLLKAEIEKFITRYNIWLEGNMTDDDFENKLELFMGALNAHFADGIAKEAEEEQRAERRAIAEEVINAKGQDIEEITKQAFGL